MNKVIICRGIQASGKSTFATTWAEDDSVHRVRINRDDIRCMLGEYWVPEREELVNKIQRSILIHSLDMGYDIVIDDMNLNKKYTDELIKVIELYPNYTYEFKNFTNVPLDVCIDRDSKRKSPIGEKVIRATYEKYKDILNK